MNVFKARNIFSKNSKDTHTHTSTECKVLNHIIIILTSFSLLNFRLPFIFPVTLFSNSIPINSFDEYVVSYLFLFLHDINQCSEHTNPTKFKAVHEVFISSCHPSPLSLRFIFMRINLFIQLKDN